MSRHSRLTSILAAPRNLRFGTLVLLLIMVNQINDPMVDATFGQAFLFWGLRPIVLAGGLWLADELVGKFLGGRLTTPEWLKPAVLVPAFGLLPLAITEGVMELHLPFRPTFY